MLQDLDRSAILEWLREDDPARLETLWAAADETRRRHPQHHGAGDAQQDRGLRTGADARRQHRDAQPHAAGVSREVRDLPRQNLRQRDRRDVPRVSARGGSSRSAASSAKGREAAARPDGGGRACRRSHGWMPRSGGRSDTRTTAWWASQRFPPE